METISACAVNESVGAQSLSRRFGMFFFSTCSVNLIHTSAERCLPTVGFSRILGKSERRRSHLVPSLSSSEHRAPKARRILSTQRKKKGEAHCVCHRCQAPGYARHNLRRDGTSVHSYQTTKRAGSAEQMKSLSLPPRRER